MHAAILAHQILCFETGNTLEFTTWVYVMLKTNLLFGASTKLQLLTITIYKKVYLNDDDCPSYMYIYCLY